MAIKYLDAKRLKLVFIGGGKWVTKHEELLNELNVYPVPDGDTGSNMSMTLNSMINDLEEKTDDKIKMPELIEVVEEAVLMGARGNSGTILSQVITGFLKGIGDKVKLLPKDVAEALLSAKETAYSAVSEPIEGTILTVIRKISEKAMECADKFEDLVEFLREIVVAGEKAVEETPELLPKLKETGVVDAGGKGLFFFFEGFYKVATELNLLVELQKAQVKENEFDKTIANIDHDPESIHFQYCTEYIILNGDFDTEEYKKRVLELGDSAVFAQTSKKFKTHIHTNHPGKAMEIALEYGPLEKMKIENMKLQHDNLQIFSERDEAKIFVNPKIDKTKSAFVILADSENLKDEFLKIGADVVILGGQSKNPSVQEILNAIDKTEKENVYVLPNNKNVILSAEQAKNIRQDLSIAVLPTKYLPQGICAMMNFKERASLEENVEMMNEMIDLVSTGEVTKAIRDTQIGDVEITTGDFLAIYNGKIVASLPTLLETLDKMVALIEEEGKEFVTVYTGLDCKDEGQAILEKLEEDYPDLEFELHHGGQEVYHVMLSAE